MDIHTHPKSDIGIALAKLLGGKDNLATLLKLLVSYAAWSCLATALFSPRSYQIDSSPGACKCIYPPHSLHLHCRRRSLRVHMRRALPPHPVQEDLHM